jgi:hypothetical protein
VRHLAVNLRTQVLVKPTRRGDSAISQQQVLQLLKVPIDVVVIVIILRWAGLATIFMPGLVVLLGDRGITNMALLRGVREIEGQSTLFD